MGVDISALNFILNHKQRIKGKVLQIGRQGLHYCGDYVDPDGVLAPVSEKIFQQHKLGFTAAETYQDSDGHTEKLFRLLGADEVVSIDYSPYEQADIIHDLNDPVLDFYHDQFDYILDCGTMEHIFDIKTYLNNIKNMLKVGGTFVVMTPANNFLGHGFYQFSPELFRTVFSADAGYKIHSLQVYEVVPEEPYFYITDVPAPKRGDRQEIKTTRFNGFNLAVCIEKISNNLYIGNYQQSDYLRIWGAI